MDDTQQWAQCYRAARADQGKLDRTIDTLTGLAAARAAESERCEHNWPLSSAVGSAISDRSRVVSDQRTPIEMVERLIRTGQATDLRPYWRNVVNALEERCANDPEEVCWALAALAQQLDTP